MPNYKTIDQYADIIAVLGNMNNEDVLLIKSISTNTTFKVTKADLLDAIAGIQEVNGKSTPVVTLILDDIGEGSNFKRMTPSERAKIALLKTDQGVDKFLRGDGNYGTPPGSVGLPAGGEDGQILVKQSEADGDAGWEDPTNGATVSPAFGDKNITAQATSSDGDYAGVELSNTPIGHVSIYIEGLFTYASSGTKSGHCYWSRNGGVTALLLTDLQNGDRLYWMGNNAEYQLNENYRITLVYNT